MRLYKKDHEKILQKVLFSTLEPRHKKLEGEAAKIAMEAYKGKYTEELRSKMNELPVWMFMVSSKLTLQVANNRVYLSIAMIPKKGRYNWGMNMGCSAEFEESVLLAAEDHYESLRLEKVSKPLLLRMKNHEAALEQYKDDAIALYEKLSAALLVCTTDTTLKKLYPKLYEVHLRIIEEEKGGVPRDKQIAISNKDLESTLKCVSEGVKPCK